MKRVSLFLLALAVACSGSTVAVDDHSATHDTVSVVGPLHLAVTDFTTHGGILWALPSITPAVGGVVVDNTRYGSLCRFDVAGRADVQGGRIDLHVEFGERLTLCTAEIRALRYTAIVDAAPGTYAMTVIHHFGTTADTLRRETVVVR